METIVLTLGTAAMIGAMHAFETDHMLAVTTFVTRRPALGTAVRFGARWGIGHSLAVLALGGLVVLTGLRWPERYDAVAEAAVGVMLAGLGVWAIVSARKLHLHTAEEHGGHAHLHLHAGDPGHTHPHHRRDGGHDHGQAQGHAHGHGHAHGGITLVGLLHGLAGTGGVVALLPVTLIENRALGVGYLAAFGIGVTLGMMLFALVAAAVMRETNHRSLAWGRRATTLVGLAGIAVGAWWVWRAMA